MTVAAALGVTVGQLAFDSFPDDPVEAVGFNAAADINENGGGGRPVCADAVDGCIHFFDREED
jgi:hypothetical protein